MHYEELAASLHDQLGVPPAAETTALYRKLTSLKAIYHNGIGTTARSTRLPTVLTASRT